MTLLQGPSLMEATKTHSVVVGKRLSIATYKGTALSQVDKGETPTLTVAELENISKPGDYWVKGFLQIADVNQKFDYIGCSNCHSKTSADEEDIPYTCCTCLKEVKTTSWPLIVMTITDHTNAIRVLAIENITERILQTTASQIFKITNLGQIYEVDAIKSDFQDKVFLMLLHRTYGKQNENQRKMLVVAFYDMHSYAAP
ncbi:hypothetical protein LIER_16532 [Lithospermum erythrorhizon]|uniref:Replication factor A C-terminal domain-containing protein n=1 Tax=Lithospermum erythrorhizon TaxID=34254 RepID=A0AAV3Q710_LITER